MTNRRKAKAFEERRARLIRGRRDKSDSQTGCCGWAATQEGNIDVQNRLDLENETKKVSEGAIKEHKTDETSLEWGMLQDGARGPSPGGPGGRGRRRKYRAPEGKRREKK